MCATALVAPIIREWAERMPLSVRNILTLEWGNPAMESNSAAQNDARTSSSGRSRSPESIVLGSHDSGPRTLGFPALQNDRTKRVWFDPPWPGLCLLDGGTGSTDCVVLGVWENGARIRVRDPRI